MMFFRSSIAIKDVYTAILISSKASLAQKGTSWEKYQSELDTRITTRAVSRGREYYY